MSSTDVWADLWCYEGIATTHAENGAHIWLFALLRPASFSS